VDRYLVPYPVHQEYGAHTRTPWMEQPTTLHAEMKRLRIGTRAVQVKQAATQRLKVDGRPQVSVVATLKLPCHCPGAKLLKVRSAVNSCIISC
jgi:hypothetical protein